MHHSFEFPNAPTNVNSVNVKNHVLKLCHKIRCFLQTSGMNHEGRNVIYKFFKNLRQSQSLPAFNFVPKHSPAEEKDIESLRDFIQKSQKIVIVTGAGISTESGIPDYRSEEVGLYARSNHRPIHYQEFIKSAQTRQRYWARNYVGWPRFSNCEPNSAHVSVKNLEARLGKVSAVITQNVDGLHQKAGSTEVIELHGSAFRVVCLSCNSLYDRHYIQRQLRESNPYIHDISTMIRPDGDVEISQETVNSFNPPFCEKCGGVLKPDIVFFGDNVPRSRVDSVRRVISENDSVLVLGSSLFVYSGFRIVLQALEERKDVAIVNIGPTRADKVVGLKVSAKCGDVLPRVVN